jgi:predicted naringenin-chalcone synthase
VLVMLSNLVASGVPQSGDTGLMLALGPGFAAEMLAIVW